MSTKKVLQERNPVFPSVIISVILFAICISFIIMLRYSIQEREILEVTERFMTFESKLERLIYSNITLLQGYEAYIESNPKQNEESTYIYLDNLISNNSQYIRNIGVIKDTTIIWNYPKASNAGAIGVDLSKIQQQRDLVLKVKKELKPVLQGPVNLVQGGSGFIVRLPIVKDKTNYWGQISIVLNSDKLLKEISSYAESSGLKLAIYNEQNEDVPFWGSVSSNGDSRLIFDIDPTLINWKAYVYYTNGWFANIFLFVVLIVLSGAVSGFVGILVYKYLQAINLIFDMSIHDSLSGLYNRHFWDEYQTMVLSAAKRNKRKAGIMLLDLNNFKDINDNYGHDIGDKVLIETSRILKESTRANEAAFRFGGDEFLIILPEIENEESLEIIKERLLKCFDQEFSILGNSIKVTPSIGCAIYPNHGQDIDTLLHIADKKMYQAKLKSN